MISSIKKLCLPPGTNLKLFSEYLPESVLNAMPDYPPFYQRVWLACALIPKGETRSYQQLACAAGSPKAARAVGMALKHNPFAPTVPCHRVIRKSGELGGFSAPGGPKKKAALLRHERAPAINDII